MSEEDWDWLFWSPGYTVHAAKRFEHKDRDKIERKAMELVGKLGALRSAHERLTSPPPAKASPA